MKFKDKTILITGASSGIGRAVALRIAQDGGTLILSARNVEKLESVAKEVRSKGASVEIIPADVTNVEDIRQLFEQIGMDGRKINGLFNNAGLAYIGKLWELKAEEIEKMVNVNVMGMMMVTRFAAEKMADQQSGHIIMTSSLAGLITLPQWSVYVGTKWAITGFADSIRPELAQKNVRVTTLHPGAVKTEFFDTDKANIDIDKLGQAVEAEQVANAVYKAFFTNRKKIFVPGSVRLFWWFKRFMPWLADFIVSKVTTNAEYRSNN